MVSPLSRGPGRASIHLILIALFFVIAYLTLLIHFQYSFNPDAVAYLRIASYYQNGQWSRALNAYWSPLLSWFLWPLYSIGLPWLSAFRVFNLLVGLFTLYKLYQLLTRHFAGLSGFARFTILLTFAAQLLYQEFITVTPDLLTLCLLCCLADIYLSDTVLERPVLTGLLGALLFFSKSYCFYFFIAFIAIYTGMNAWTNGLRKFRFRALLLLGLSFALPTGTWITLNHAKYGVWQVSGASAYLYNNLDSNGVTHHPFDITHKLMPLPYPGAYCMWEDPQLTYHYSTRQGLSQRRLSWYKGLIGANLHRLWDFLLQTGIGWLFLLPLAGWLVSLRPRVSSRMPAAFRTASPSSPLFGPSYIKMLLFACLYVSGYMLIFVTGRYIWFSAFVIWIFIYRTVDGLASTSSRPWFGKGLIAILTMYFIYSILYPIPYHFYFGREDHLSEKTIVHSIPAGSNFATWYSKDGWTPLCQYDLHDFGGIASYTNWEELREDLQTYKVHYLLLTNQAYTTQLPATIAAHLTQLKQVGNWTLYSFNL
jgi:hypothetical protein